VKLSKYGPATRKRDLNRTSEEFEKWRTTRGFNESGVELVVLWLRRAGDQGLGCGAGRLGLADGDPRE
jgi:hypothetical protein